ncbi:hypothetical protein ABB37_08293 [Leptomonas pyrrhocoris]|uniref:Uncharacterized protein n=1 Tax=Leptomonas pyrrhocoris TaxID=157538 RepID=A0A0N1J4E0_LEPPY|nr:hypothetical protein ABB37_08293 [Leptomonas pyrrhocoris]KPA75758.1 hypothetical protein ABB37_08293 [Leptomonas pyrrhocoris]|eukprot:XP_015654197.1 hypothetical protein ABB37_08293 [Leptomonas pyrrhocoris]
MSIQNLPPQRIPYDGDFFMTATAPFPVRDTKQQHRLSHFCGGEMALTNPNVMAHCWREEAYQKRLSAACQKLRSRLVSATSLRLMPHLVKDPNTSRELRFGVGKTAGAAAAEEVEVEAEADEKETDPVISAYMSEACVSERSRYVADLTARIQERAGRRGRRSRSARHVAGSRSPGSGTTVSGCDYTAIARTFQYGWRPSSPA